MLLKMFEKAGAKTIQRYGLNLLEVLPIVLRKVVHVVNIVRLTQGAAAAKMGSGVQRWCSLYTLVAVGSVSWLGGQNLDQISRIMNAVKIPPGTMSHPIVVIQPIQKMMPIDIKRGS